MVQMKLCQKRNQNKIFKQNSSEKKRKKKLKTTEIIHTINK